MSYNLQNSNTWVNQNLRTILITGGEDIQNPSLISLLENNAIEQTPCSPKMIDDGAVQSNLTDVADSIRNSVKKTGALNFPNDFLTELGRLPCSYEITTVVNHGSSVGNSRIVAGGVAKIKIFPESGYKLPSGVTVTDYTYDTMDQITYSYSSSTGVITLKNPVNEIKITVTCAKIS